jgi:hypothetical protein
MCQSFLLLCSGGPVGDTIGKFGGTELQRELNSLRSSAFYSSFVRFSADFVPKRRSLMGVFCFNPHPAFNFAEKDDRGFDDLPLIGSLRCYEGQNQVCMLLIRMVA